MRKLFGLAVLAAMVGFTSCTVENEGGSNTNSAMSFTFNMPQSSFVTYADIATTNEWFIDAIDVYAAVGGTVEKLTSADDYTLDGSGKKYTITMKQSWVNANAGKTANFYFVGNDEISAEGAHDALSLATNLASEALFKNALTNELGNTGDKLNLIEKPNGSSKGLLFSAYLEGVKVEGKVNKSTTLYRREARFDIENPMFEGGAFVVTDVLVSNASKCGMIFGNGNPDGVNISKMSHKSIGAVAEGAYDATGLAASVFYLYPTEMGDGLTEIVIMGKTRDGEEMAFPVDGSAVNNKIEANTRYILALDEATLTFLLNVADYNDGGRLPATLPTTDAIALGGFTTAHTGFNPTTNVLTFDNQAGTLTFTATSKYGTQAEIVYVIGKESALSTPLAVNKTGSVTTYGFGTVDTYTVQIPVVSGFHSIYSIELNINSPFQPEAVKTVKFQYGSIDLNNPISLTAAGFDPSLAAAINAYYEIDVLTPELLESIDVLDFNGYQGINSTAGLEYFPNLDAIALMGNMNLTFVDFSKNPKLRAIHFFDSNITSIDFSNNPMLEQLIFSGHDKVTELDLSKNPNLCITQVLYNANLMTIDVSNNKLLRDFQIEVCPNLKTMIVWEGFDTEDIYSNFSNGLGIDKPENITWVIK